jgi:hypothetical protein
MAQKNKGGRETRKPKLDKNKKQKGQTPAPATAALNAVNDAAHSPKR